MVNKPLTSFLAFIMISAALFAGSKMLFPRSSGSRCLSGYCNPPITNQPVSPDEPRPHSHHDHFVANEK